MRRFLLAVFLSLAVVASLVLYPRLEQRAERQKIIQEVQSVVVPKSTRLPSTEKVKTLTYRPQVFAEVSWDVPFTPQAPTANWDEVHQEACEEASILMVLKYFDKDAIDSPAEAEEGIQHLLALNEELGFPIDLDAQQTAAVIAHERPKLRISVVSNPTEQMLKEALSQGQLVIVPAAGRQLHNPYFQTPGPIYHMLVLRGYTKDGYVITNDPGTRRGKEYVYKWDTLLNAIHEWNGGDVENGAKAVVIVGQFVPIKGES